MWSALQTERAEKAGDQNQTGFDQGVQDMLGPRPAAVAVRYVSGGRPASRAGAAQGQQLHSVWLRWAADFGEYLACVVV